MADKGQSDGKAKKESAGGWNEGKRKVRWGKFPGPKGVREPMRVSFEQKAYADLVAHAKESLDAEICGVLAGVFCEDDEGPYVAVEAAVRGTSVKQGGAHVTYTQETWNKIHKVMEQEHPKRQIVGWYHSHPGFGVAFSDMDLFIQRNFFAGKGQLGLVTDPLGGEEAICVNGEGGIEHVARFFVAGRERRCVVPEEKAKPTAEAAAGKADKGKPVGAEKRLADLEKRLDQVLSAVEEQHAALGRFLATIGMFIIVAVVGLIAYLVYTNYVAMAESDARFGLPKDYVYAEWPVVVNGETHRLGVKLMDWKVPAKLEQAFFARAIAELEKANPSTAAPASQPAESDQSPTVPDGGKEGAQ